MSSGPSIGNPSGGGVGGGNAGTATSDTDGGAGARAGASAPHPTHVSEVAYEFLLAEILHWVDEGAAAATGLHQQQQQQATEEEGKSPKKGKKGQPVPPPPVEDPRSREELTLLSAERAAAKVERLGFGVGYRLCERLAQSRPLLGPTPTGQGNRTTNATDSQNSVTNGDSATIIISPAMQLEAVKFLCKEFWTEIFRKQIDKLQTNHRGVFVLKDHELRWLKRLPPDDETARVQAIKMLAFPCGLIRGALANLGIGAVVSCDFLADGKTMAACSFNIKVKT
uniref:Trafficking protein particle complex subunit 6B n=1 Tax=Ditylum brightwellii TaxID=49249 RepID=A0A6U3RED0_9STRA|mmetsp:Transcript_742/g.927  ORF Transcript_742/g.927 Transcript_742/m.927 type:complete len:282 (-) Transcript_742:251-1096(-)